MMSRKEVLELVKRATAMTVQTGPLAGMVMHDNQTWGDGDDIGPQLLGTYEMELHEWLNRFARKRPSTIVNVGCAEGYYAVGLARLLPTARVLAFDIHLRAQEACRNNSILNGVDERMQIGGMLSPADLVKISSEDWNILLIADCEGYEKILFSDPDSIHALEHANCIIESHDHKDREILPKLIASFAMTHRLSIVSNSARNPHSFRFLDMCSEMDKWMLICENRPQIQYWLCCERRSDP